MATGSIQTFYSGILGEYEMAKAARFRVTLSLPPGLLNRYNGYLSDLSFLCEATELPGVQLGTVDRRTYGITTKIPNQIAFGDISLTILCTEKGMWQKKLFDDWIEYINPRDFYNFKFRDSYARNIVITQFENRSRTNSESDPPIENYKVVLEEAYPIAIGSMGLNWADDGILRLNVTFAYSRWKRLTDEFNSTSVAIPNGQAKNDSLTTVGSPPAVQSNPPVPAKPNQQAINPNITESQ